VVHTACVETIGGREAGVSRSSDGLLDIRLSPPGWDRIGTNPEQLLAAGWSASFESAIALAAREKEISLVGDVRIHAEVDLKLGEDVYFLSVRLRVNLPGVSSSDAIVLIERARSICPFCEATRGNIVATINSN
jgi:Ohr subfamily peroxiredoxin